MRDDAPGLAPEAYAEGYADDGALMQDLLDLLALRVNREMLRSRAQEGDRAAADALDPRIGTAAGRITRRFAASPARALPRLVRALALSDLEVDVLLIAAAPALDPQIARAFAQLQGEPGAPTLALARRLVGGRADLATLRATLDQELPLRRYRLVLRADGDREDGLMDAPLVVEDIVIDHLLGRPATDIALAGLVERIAPVAPALPPGTAAAEPVALACVGDAEAAAEGLAAGLGLSLHRLDWGAWRHLPPAQVRGRLGRAMRAARLARALPVLAGFEAAPDPVLRALAEELEAPACLATGGPAFWRAAGVHATAMEAQPATAADRARVWTAERGHGTPPELPLSELRPLAREAGGAAGVARALHDRARREMAGLADEIMPVLTLDDLVLPSQAAARLRAIAARQRHARTVLDDWGLGRAYDGRPGVCALFAGPSGTGKTAAAAALGQALDLPVWRIDLAGTVSKYIGETEKNLDRVFAAAARARVLLIFDEADALFGKRSEVSDSHDRYANIQVSFLLQRIERHEGPVVLTTNLQQNMDEAFLRRIDVVVVFPLPRPAERRRLWARLGASGAPLADDVDLDGLAERFELTGGSIRNCAIAAAQTAAAAERPIAMADLMQAIAHELAKAGRPISRADFAGSGADLRGI